MIFQGPWWAQEWLVVLIQRFISCCLKQGALLRLKKLGEGFTLSQTRFVSVVRGITSVWAILFTLRFLMTNKLSVRKALLHDFSHLLRHINFHFDVKILLSINLFLWIDDPCQAEMLFLDALLIFRGKTGKHKTLFIDWWSWWGKHVFVYKALSRRTLSLWIGRLRFLFFTFDHWSQLL